MRRTAAAHTSPTRGALGKPLGRDSVTIFRDNVLVSIGEGCVTEDKAARMYKSCKARARFRYNSV